MAEAGVISRELAERLAPAAGLRHVLVHRYADISAATRVHADSAGATSLPEDPARQEVDVLQGDQVALGDRLAVVAGHLAQAVGVADPGPVEEPEDAARS